MVPIDELVELVGCRVQRPALQGETSYQLSGWMYTHGFHPAWCIDFMPKDTPNFLLPKPVLDYRKKDLQWHTRTISTVPVRDY